MSDPDKVRQNSDKYERPGKEENHHDPTFKLPARPDDTLLSFVQSRNKIPPNRISIPLRQGIIELVQIEDILYIESNTQICYVHLRDSTKLTAFKGLSYFKGLLLEDHNFFAINDKILINLNYLQRYNHKELAVTLTDKKILNASRRGGQRLRKFLQDKKLY